MSLSGILLGLINIAIVSVILLLVGAIVLWVLNWLGLAVPWNIQRLYIAVVLLIALYMLVALIFSIPTIRVIQHRGPLLGGNIPPAPSIMIPEQVHI